MYILRYICFDISLIVRTTLHLAISFQIPVHLLFLHLLLVCLLFADSGKNEAREQEKRLSATEIILLDTL
jgi:hypothetical protein